MSVPSGVSRAVHERFVLQSMTLKEAIKSSLVILKQVMEEKLNATNIEVTMATFLWPSGSGGSRGAPWPC